MSLIRPFRDMSLRRKLALVGILPITVVTLAMVIVISVGHLQAERGNIAELSAALGDLLARKISVSVFLSDAQSSGEILDALSSVPKVLYARGRNDRTGFESVYYRSDLDRGRRAAVDRLVAGESSDRLIPHVDYSTRPIIVNGERVGDFDLVLDTSSVRDSLIQVLILSAMVLVLAAAFAAMLLRELNRRVLSPILELGEAMNEFSEGRATRLPVDPQREIDDLNRGFNEMTDTIGERDARLARHRQDLEREVAERSAALVVLNERRIAWLERMAFFLQHELDNKIVGISSTLDLMERNDADGGLTSYIDRARRTTVQMHQLLASVADATTFEAALDEEDKVEVDLSKVMSQQLEEYRAVYPDALFEGRLTPGVVVLGSESRLVQLLDKLVANAVQHDDRSGPITLSLLVAGGEARLTVENRGRGLPGDSVKLFDLAYTTSPDDYRKRGMGLFVVRLIAQNHGGEVRAESVEHGRGARFVVVLPRLVETKKKSN